MAWWNGTQGRMIYMYDEPEHRCDDGQLCLAPVAVVQAWLCWRLN